jgi:hypothetical protein
MAYAVDIFDRDATRADGHKRQNIIFAFYSPDCFLGAVFSLLVVQEYVLSALPRCVSLG